MVNLSVCIALLTLACSFCAICSAYRIDTVVKDGIPDNSNIDVSPFVKIDNGLYYFETKEITNWFDANDRCHRMDAELVSFESLEEWNSMNNYLKDKSIEAYYWTSGNDLAKQHTHVWLSNGLPLTLPEIWAPGEPNNHGGNERCDELGFRANPTDKRALNDMKCSVLRRFICEKRDPKTLSFVVW